MNAYRIVWEDEAKAREIELFVDYTADAGSVRIDGVRPSTVTFYNPETKSAERTVGVHTRTGRELLSRVYLASRPVEPTLENEILAQLAERDGMAAAELAC